MARASVEVRDTLSGKIWAVYKGRRIEMKEAERPKPAASNKATKDKGARLVNAHKPAPDHPWKRSFRKNAHLIGNRR